MKNNQRKAIKKKLKRRDMIDKRRDDELYAQSRLDKNTWEGQTKLPITDIQPKKDNKNNNWSWMKYIGVL